MLRHNSKYYLSTDVDTWFQFAIELQMAYLYKELVLYNLMSVVSNAIYTNR